MAYYENIKEKGVLNTVLGGTAGGLFTIDDLKRDERRQMIVRGIEQATDETKNENVFTTMIRGAKTIYEAARQSVSGPQRDVMTLTTETESLAPDIKKEKAIAPAIPEQKILPQPLNEGEPPSTPYEKTSANFDSLNSMSVETFAALKEGIPLQPFSRFAESLSRVEVGDVFSRLKEPRPVEKPKDIGRTSELLTTGFVGGLNIPGAFEQMYNQAQPKGFWEKAAFYSAMTLSSITSIGGIEKIIEKPVMAIANPIIKSNIVQNSARALERNFPFIYRLITGQEGIDKLLEGTFKLMPSLAAYNQISLSLNTPLQERIRSALRTIPDALFFSRFALMKNPVSSISSQAAYGFVATKLDGGSTEDAMVQGMIFGGLGAWHVLNLPPREMQRALIEKSRDVVQNYSASFEPRISNNFKELYSLITKGKFYAFSPERKSMEEIVFPDIRESVAAGDHVKVSNLIRSKVKDVFSYAGISDEKAKTYPAIGSYFGSDEGSVLVVTPKPEPLVEYLSVGLSKFMNQESILVGNASRNVKKEHPNILIEISNIDTMGGNTALANKIEELTGKKFHGHTQVGRGMVLISYVPEFARYDNLSPSEALASLRELPVKLREQGFEVKNAKTFFSSNKAVWNEGKVEVATDTTYEQQLSAARTKAGLSKFGGEDAFLRGALQVLERGGVLYPDKLLSSFKGKKISFAEFPSELNRSFKESSGKFLKAIDESEIIARIEERKTKTGEGFDSFLKDITLGGRVSDEQWKNFLISREVERQFEDYTRIDYKEFESGFRVAGGEGKVAYDFGPVPQEIFTREDVINFLVDVPRGKSSVESIARALKNYFPNEKEAVRFFNELRSRFDRGEQIGDIKFVYRLDDEIRGTFNEVIKRFKETDGEFISFVGSILNQDISKLTGTDLTHAYQKANKFAHELNFQSAKQLYGEIMRSIPEITQPIERLKLATELTKEAAVDKIQYNFSGDLAITTSEESFFKPKNVIPDSALSTEKRLVGRKEIIEDVIDRLDVAFRKAKLPAGVEGRAHLDQIIEQKSNDATVAFHEITHVLDARYNLLENAPKEVLRAMGKELGELVNIKNAELGSNMSMNELKEAFASFGSHYVIGENARERFPITSDYFESALGAKAPEILDSLKMAHQRFRDLIEAPTLAAAKAEIYSATDAPILEKMRESLKNPSRTIEDIQKWLRDSYRTQLNVFDYFRDIDSKWGLKLENGVYYKAYSADQRRAGLVYFMLERGIPQYESWKAVTDASKEVDSIKMEYEGGLLELYRSFPVQYLEDISAFRKAKESLKRAQIAERKGVPYVTNPLFTPERSVRIMQEVREKFPGVDMVVARFEQWYNALRKFYRDAGIITEAEFLKLKENPMYAHLNRVGNIFDNDFQSFKRFNDTILKRSGGSMRGFQDPIIDDITEIEGLAKRVVTNDILKELYAHSSKHPLREVSRGSPDIRPIHIEPEEVIRVMKELMPPETPKRYFEEIRELITENPEIISKIWRPTLFQDDHVRVLIDGEPHYLRMDKNLQDAIGVIRNQGFASHLPEILKVYTKTKRLLATTFSTSFAVRNPIRDAFTAYFQSERLIAPFATQYSGLKHIFQKDEVFWRGVLGGLEASSIISPDINEMMRLFYKVTGKTKQGIFPRLVDFVQTFAEYGELATRFGILEKYNVKNPSELRRGILDAREATFNWSQRGVSGSFAGEMNALSAFFKAHLIVMDKEIRTLLKKPGVVLKRGMPFTLLSIALANLYGDDPEWQNLPMWRRLTSLNFKVGDKWFFLPIPDIYGMLFVTFPQFIYSELQKSDPHLAKEFLSEALKQFSLVKATDIIPDAIRPIIEDAVNMDFFSRRNIVPEYLKDVVPQEQYDRYTGDAAIAIAKGANALGIEWSPFKVEHFLRGYLISLYDLSRSVVNTTLDAFGMKQNAFREEFELVTAPVVSSFIRNEYDPSSQYQVSKLSDTYKRLDGVHRTYNSLLKIEPSKALEFYQDHVKEMSYYPSVKAQYDTIRNYIALYRQLQKTSEGDDDVRKVKARQLKNLILQQALIANDIIENNFGL